MSYTLQTAEDGWQQDFATLRREEERYKRVLGRVLLLIVEREDDNWERWEARTSNAHGYAIRLARKFDTKEEAMAALEKKAGRLLQDAIESLAPNHRP